MRLNSSAADAINLLPKPDHPSQFGSLYGILNRCKTKMGSRLLERWLRQPLVDENEINLRLDIVETIKESTTARHQLSEESLKSIPDLEIIMLNPELHELSEQLSDIEERANKILDNFTSKYDDIDGGNIRLEDNQQHGYILRSTKNDDCAKLSKISIVHVYGIQKNGVHFTTKELQRLAEQRSQLQASYKQMQQEVVSKVLDTAISYLPLVEIANGIISELDVLTGFAIAAAISPNSYHRPKILPKGSGIIDIKGARHPCVELMDGISYISNDYKLIKDQSNYQIITGPNMGGKSTYIRGLGSITVLAQVGSFIPCDEPDPTITIVDSILARVGAGDAVQKGVSTFMAEMLEASVILQTLTTDSLLIIDELGRGTSTFDGYAESAGFPQEVINEAKRKAIELERNDEIDDNINEEKIEEANKRIRQSMDKFKDLPIKSIPADMIRETLQPLFPAF
eukprot:gene27980-36867_t